MIDENILIEKSEKKPRRNVRAQVMVGMDLYKVSFCIMRQFVRLRDARELLHWGMKHPSRGKERIKVDIDALVEKWVDTVAGLATSHDRDSFDRWDFTTDELLRPLMSAPVKQVRDFNAKLIERLKNDTRIPFFVWAMFEAWDVSMVRTARDSSVVKLQKKLAKEIADLLEEDVKPQLATAMMNALQWRPAETLKRVKEKVKAGAKPKLVGRESCLFIEVGGELVQL